MGPMCAGGVLGAVCAGGVLGAVCAGGVLGAVCAGGLGAVCTRIVMGVCSRCGAEWLHVHMEKGACTDLSSYPVPHLI
jgi:hypothetical protein